MCPEMFNTIVSRALCQDFFNELIWISSWSLDRSRL